MLYTKASCPICARHISKSGVASWNHGMAHVRRGEARREVTTQGVRFIPLPRMIQLTLDDALAALLLKTAANFQVST